MNLGVLFLTVMIFLIIVGIPVAFSIGFASMLAIYIGGYELIVMPQKIFSGLESFPMLAIPFFLLTGNFMTAGGLNDRIMKFANAVVGWLEGGMAVITVVASSIFAAISGSGVATVSSIGGITIPAMIKEKYDKGFAAAVASSSAILGPLIPPSIFLIVYGNSAQVSVQTLFKAAVIPGISLSSLFMLYSYYYGRKHKLKAVDKFEWESVVEATKSSIWALLLPIIILGGIFGGIFTPTEAAAVSAVYALIVGLFVYKNLNLDSIFEMLKDSAITSAALMFLMGTSKISSWALAVDRVPETIAQGILGISSYPIIIMLSINIFLVLVGMIMEGNVAIVILTPILLPLALEAGLSPVQFGVVMCVNLCIGLVTPPVGNCLALGNSIAGSKFEDAFKETVPFIIIGLVVLMLTTYFKPMTLLLGK